MLDRSLVYHTKLAWYTLHSPIMLCGLASKMADQGGSWEAGQVHVNAFPARRLTSSTSRRITKDNFRPNTTSDIYREEHFLNLQEVFDGTTTIFITN
jgi:hypothetical protein